jgi:hypothetical protein
VKPFFKSKIYIGGNYFFFNLPTDNIHIFRLFYTCGLEVNDVTRGDEMTRGRDDHGTKWPGTKWPRDEMTRTKWPGTKWKGTNRRVTIITVIKLSNSCQKVSNNSETGRRWRRRRRRIRRFVAPRTGTTLPHLVKINGFFKKSCFLKGTFSTLKNRFTNQNRWGLGEKVITQTKDS